MMPVKSPIVIPVIAMPALIAGAMRRVMAVPVMVAVAVMRVFVRPTVAARPFWSGLHMQSLSRVSEERAARQIWPRGNAPASGRDRTDPLAQTRSKRRRMQELGA